MQDKYAVINHVERRFVDPESDALATSKVTLFCVPFVRPYGWDTGYRLQP